MATSDAFYQELIGEIDTIIDELGTTYQIRGKGAFDTATLSATPTSPRTVAGLVANQQIAHNLGSQIFPVTEFSAAWVGKKTLILKASAEPKSGEEVLVDGNWFPLAKVVPIKPADVTVLYMLDVAR